MNTVSWSLAILALISIQLTTASITPDNDFQLVNQLEKVNEEFDLNKLTGQWMETCERNNGSEAVENIHDSVQTLYSCILSQVNVANLTDEIELAKPKGALDEVFARYCNMMPELRKCRDPLTESIQVCLDDQGDQDLDNFNAAVDAALDFMCYKGGERIAIFLAEDGTQCLMSNMEKLTNCLTETVPSVMSVFQNLESSNGSIYDETNCHIETKLKTCIVSSLKSCSDPTPANIIEGLMDSMHRATPCFVPSSASTSLSFSLFSWLLNASLMILFSVLQTRLSH